MNVYHIDDVVKYVSNNNEVNQGSIVRYLRNGNVIVQSEDKNNKIPLKNVVTNITTINDLINYTNDLEHSFHNKIEYIKQLENEIDETLFICKCFLIISMIFLFLCFAYYFVNISILILP
jgi:predicted RND superfamily exporter protein